MWVAGANASSEGRYPGTGRQNSSWARTGFATAHIVEAQDQEAAAAQLGTLPLVQHEVTSFRLTPLAPGFGGRRNGRRQVSSGGNPPVATGPQDVGVTRSRHLPWSSMAWRYSSQSGCSPEMQRK